MQKSPRLFRVTTTVALTALLWDPLLPLIALAQPAPPPLPVPGEGRPDLNQADPPARVGRVTNMTGALSFHNAGDTQWTAASPNYPVSSGNAFWTEPSSAARLEISDSRIGMAGSTEFDVATLDANGLQGIAAQGEVYIHLRDLAPTEVWSIQTPRGLVRLNGDGRYEIVAGTTDQPTRVTVVDGAAQIDGPGVSLQLAANQTATITGIDTFQGTTSPALRSAFLTASLDAERPRPAATAPVPTQVYAMAGGSDLDNLGSWSQAPTYGRVWYPPVAATWVPYREGHWAYVAPWGWTWIDDASWGFAPFHYGRWIQIGGRWAWTPGAVVAERPVYAPALVTFIGIGAGVALGAALASGSIGWVPLGPREQFHPWYHASNNYIQQVNVSHVTNITNNVTTNNYINRGAATSIPTAVMMTSRPVQSVARPVNAQEFATARPITGRQPIRPTATTAGVTPVVARQLNLAPAAAVVHAAPGPAVRPVAAGAAGFTRPGFVPGERTQAPGATSPIVAPMHPVVPTTPGARPVTAPMEPSRPSAILPTAPHQPPVMPQMAHPAGAPAPSIVARPAVPQAALRPEQSNAVRPEAGPQTFRPVQLPTTSRPMQPPTARSEAVAVAPRSMPQPAPHVAPQLAPRPAPQAAPLPQPATIRPEPQPAQRPAPMIVREVPHAEPQRAPSPAAPHPEARPTPPARPEPQERRKEPGER